ncbi:MAG: pitrilysin family protein, partial [Alphaproteobacteria bacterium]
MSVEVSRLSNGFAVATDRMDHVETVAIGVWVGIGARHESPELNGVSHMLEHMAFKGTARRSAQDIVNQVESVGGQINAYTSRENTAYYLRVLAGDVGLAVDILADILQNSTFEAEELERERAVILQEIGQCTDTPD